MIDQRKRWKPPAPTRRASTPIPVTGVAGRQCWYECVTSPAVVVNCHDQANSNCRQRKVLVAPTTKEGQRAELHKTIWRIANDLRGSVDGWDFKSYVLGMLFYRFISENLTAYLNEQERAAGQPRLRLRQAQRHRTPSSAAKRRSRRRASTSSRASCSSTSASGPATTRT